MCRLVLHRSFPLAGCLALAAGLPLLGAGIDDDAPAGRKYALLVGVKYYDKDQLRSLRFTESDVNDLAAVLQDAGYKRVVLMTESGSAAGGDTSLLPTAKNIRKQLAAMLDGRRPEDAVVVAFSGHGVQFREQKESYFCPMDADLADAKSLVSLGEVYKGLEECVAGTKVLLVDACRNDPQAEASKAVEKVKLESVTRPQAERPPGGVAALFSCSEGQRSYESEKLGHGVFFHYVIEGLKGEAANKKGEVTLQRLVAYVTDEVPDAAKDISTEARQRPQQVGDVSGAVALAGVVLKQVIANSLGMKLKLIRPGHFLMGSPDDEDGHRPDEARHEVGITRPFYMAPCPVTVGQFREFISDSGFKTEAEANGKGGMGYNAQYSFPFQSAEYTWRNPGFTQTDSHPVVEVSWADAAAFCRWLGKKEGKVYELPTEAEWEYACRAGSTSRFWWGEEEQGVKGNENIADVSLKGKFKPLDISVPWLNDGYAFTSPVGEFKPNPWGLYDMEGDVRQWCSDWYGDYPKGPAKDPKGPDKGKGHVTRGASWREIPIDCRCSMRGAEPPPFAKDSELEQWPVANYDLGFRVVLRSTARSP